MFLVYTRLVAALVACVSVVRPIRLLRIRTRLCALAVLGLALLVVAIGFALPVAETRLAASRSRLDEFAPVYQFEERHSIVVHASTKQCYAAVRAVAHEHNTTVSRGP